jgi:hypothetical protein
MRVQHAPDQRQCNDNGVLHWILHPDEMTYEYSAVRIFCRAGLVVRFNAPDYKLEMKQTAPEFAERAVCSDSGRDIQQQPESSAERSVPAARRVRSAGIRQSWQTPA